MSNAACDAAPSLRAAPLALRKLRTRPLPNLSALLAPLRRMLSLVAFAALASRAKFAARTRYRSSCSARRYLWHVLPPAPLAHLEICARPSCSGCKGRAEKNWRGDESKTQDALPDDGKREQTNKEVRSHVS